jgi:hypothetical protein
LPTPLAPAAARDARRRHYDPAMERNDLSDRQFEALLERLDGLAHELRALNRRLDNGDQLDRIAREVAALNESLGALALAALGQRGPEVRRRRAG